MSTYTCSKCGESDLGMYGHHDRETDGFTCDKKERNQMGDQKIAATGTWDISIYVECPVCEEYFDMVQEDHEFLRDNDLETKTVEADCPRCRHELTVKLDFFK